MYLHRIRSLSALVVGLAFCCATEAFGAADARTPLLQPGKQTLFQRVISHPGALAASVPGGTPQQPVQSFTPFYVYERRQTGNETWLEVSPSAKGAERAVWLRARECSDWNQALTLMFADRMGRDPVFFFRNFRDLNNVVRSEDMRVALDYLRKTKSDFGGPLLAVEPERTAVPRDSFYLMPVFGFSDEYEAHNLRLLNIGIVDPGSGPAAAPAAPAAPRIPQRFTAGVAFIVDTTISMGPYIEQTKKFVGGFYDQLAQSPIAEDVSFAVVGYRNSTRFNPRLEYTASVIAPFTPLSARASAEERIARMDEAKVSTHAFNEDAFAGIKAAVDELDWSPYAVKVAVMVTDAGAIRNDDPYSSTGFTEREMADLLAQKGIRLIVVHLQTAQGKRHRLNDVIAQYKTLTAVRDGNVKSAYVPLQVKNSQTASRNFGKIARKFVDVLQQMITRTASGAVVDKPVQRDASTPEESVAYLGETLGYAAYLEFAGRLEQTRPPQLVEAWVADKDLDNLVHGKSTDSLVAAVLLNKHQLDTLARQIGLLVDAARAARSTDSRSLFQQIISLSSQTVRDPERLQQAAPENLCTQGLLPEFLEGLPYRSQVMNLTEARWTAMSAREQDELIYSLEAKLRLYEAYHNDTDNWVSFGASDPGEALYRVPLTSLP